LEGAHSEMAGTPEEPTLHPLVKRLAEVVGPPAKPGDDQNIWISAYLGNEAQIPRVYTTRASSL